MEPSFMVSILFQMPFQLGPLLAEPSSVWQLLQPLRSHWIWPHSGHLFLSRYSSHSVPPVSRNFANWASFSTVSVACISECPLPQYSAQVTTNCPITLGVNQTWV